MYAIETALGTWRREQELVKKADLYRLIVESANSIILRMDTSGNVLYLNDFGLKFFGFTKDDISGRNVIGTIVPPVDTAGRDLAAMIADIGKNPDRYVNNQNENMRSDGAKVYVAWTNRAIHDENGELTAILCVGNDITARKEAGEALERSLEEKSTLLRELQHRVKNNLTLLSMLLSMETRDLAEGHARRIIGDIQNRIKTMATLYESLYSAENLTHLDFNGYIAHLSRTLFKTFTTESQNIRLVTSLDAMRIDLKRAVPAGLILNELLTNAAKYAFAGRESGTITVELRGGHDGRCSPSPTTALACPRGSPWKSRPVRDSSWSAPSADSSAATSRSGAETAQARGSAFRFRSRSERSTPSPENGARR